MVKGCQRRVLHLKNTDSGLFEEAFFLLRDPGGAGVSHGDMVREANRILLGADDRGATSKKPIKSTGFLLGLLAGLALSAAILFIVSLII